MDGDGRAEIITRIQIDDDCYVAILDGMSGQIRHKTSWPNMVSDFSKSSTRIHLSVAYLDGQHPAVVTQTGLYENEVFAAYDGELNQLWQYDSFAETSGSGGHKIEVADVNGDGRQEVFNGTTCLNHDGTVRGLSTVSIPTSSRLPTFFPAATAWKCSTSSNHLCMRASIWSLPIPAK